MSTTFDPLTAARDLEAAGIGRRQAEAIAGTVRQATAAGREALATKADLAALRAELGTLRWTVGLGAAFLPAIGLRGLGLV